MNYKLCIEIPGLKTSSYDVAESIKTSGVFFWRIKRNAEECLMPALWIQNPIKKRMSLSIDP
jgi:hypothetical protein